VEVNLSESEKERSVVGAPPLSFLSLPLLLYYYFIISFSFCTLHFNNFLYLYFITYK